MGIKSKVLTATDCKDFLGTMFAEKTNPIVILKVIDVDDLADSWAEPRLKKYLAIESSDRFQVIVFQPDPKALKVSLT